MDDRFQKPSHLFKKNFYKYKKLLARKHKIEF